MTQTARHSSTKFAKATTDPASRLNTVVNTFEPRYKGWFRGAVASMRQELGSLGEINALIQTGQLESRLTQIALNSARGGSLIFRDAFERGAMGAAQAVTRSGNMFTFDPLSDTSITALRRAQQDFINNFVRQQLLAARTAIAFAQSSGDNVARAVRDSIGLTGNQARATANYRRLLREGSNEALTRQLRDGRFDATVLSDNVLTDAQIDKMTTRYVARSLVHRGGVIAESEANEAAHFGSEVAYGAAIAEGFLSPEDVVRQWDVNLDGRERDSHHPMEGQTRPFGQPFVSGAGNLIRFPGDPTAPANETVNCRCRLKTIIVEE